MNLGAVSCALAWGLWGSAFMGWVGYTGGLNGGGVHIWGSRMIYGTLDSTPHSLCP